MASSVPDGLKPRAREIVAAARELLGLEGPSGLSMRRVADRIGRKAPTIYKHLPDKEAHVAALIAEGFAKQAEGSGRALARCGEPLGAQARAYRALAHDPRHPYRLMTTRRMRRDLSAPGVEERAARTALRMMDEDVDGARALWAFAHGI